MRETAIARAQIDAEVQQVQAQSAQRLESEAKRLRGLASADADAIDARAQALAGENQQLIAANKLVDMLPELVKATADSLRDSRLTILNGGDGVNDLAASVVAQGLTIFETLRDAPAIAGTAADAEPPAPTNAEIASPNVDGDQSGGASF